MSESNQSDVNKLLEISTRIDERLKSIQDKQNRLETKLSDMAHEHGKSLQKIAVLESKDDCSTVCGIHQVVDHLDDVVKTINDLDKRVVVVEMATDKSQNRWRQMSTFVIQLIWVLLASWLLLKLNLQAPAIP